MAISDEERNAARRWSDVDAARSHQMSLVRGKDSAPEMAVRRLVHGLGYRYSLHRKDLIGKPDLVFSSRKKIVFVHGCFWHGHSDPACRRARLPKSRKEYWSRKIQRNAQRDAKTETTLRAAGWDVLIIWECETPPLRRAALVERIQLFLRRPD